jgi:hypothetical protein
MNVHDPVLTTIPTVDIRDGGPLQHAIEGRERARLLRDECIAFLPGVVRPLLPAMDAVTRRWLQRSSSQYVGEIAAIGAALQYPGIWFLNGCYQWGCTAQSRDEDNAPWLARTLDWPFHGLGRHVEIARMRGPAGEFHNVTWPGYAGALTAMAPGRFGAAMNQAPLFRRTRRPWLRLYDFSANALGTWRVRHTPPDHLLREVFEICRTYSEARRRLETVPVARPAIFSLVGCLPGERCVIERTEEAFITREHDTLAANDWNTPREPWEARVCSALLLTLSYEGAADNSRNRCAGLAAWPGRFTLGGFGWVVPPVLNPFTRVAVEMCAASGTMRVLGFESVAGNDLPQPATLPREIGAAREAA